MRTFIVAVLVCVGLVCLAQARPGPDSNYNLAISGGGGAYSGPGDIIASAKAWWGLRAYNAAQAGTKAINLCDNALANCSDISTNASTGKLNAGGTHGANNCDVSGTCLVKIIYDQSGAVACVGPTACDISCSVAANCPAFTPNCINTSLPCLTFTRASSQALTSSANISSATQPYSFSTVSNSSVGSLNWVLTLGAGSLGIAHDFGNPNLVAVLDQSGSNAPPVTAADNANHAWQVTVSGPSSTAINVDGTDTTGLTTDSTASGNGAIALGSNLAAANFFGGKFYETGFWPSGFTAGNRTSMCHNQFQFWATATSC